MFERFTDHARRVMLLADQEAQRLNHEYLGTEHILAGLVADGAGVGAAVLENLGVHLDRLKHEMDRVLTAAPDKPPLGKLPYTPHSKKVIEDAILEARSMNHNHVGTEHLVLGLIAEQDSIAGSVLRNLGLDVKAARAEVARLVVADTEQSAQESATAEIQRCLQRAVHALEMARLHAETLNKPNVFHDVESALALVRNACQRL